LPSRNLFRPPARGPSCCPSLPRLPRMRPNPFRLYRRCHRRQIFRDRFEAAHGMNRIPPRLLSVRCRRGARPLHPRGDTESAVSDCGPCIGWRNAPPPVVRSRSPGGARSPERFISYNQFLDCVVSGLSAKALCCSSVSFGFSIQITWPVWGQRSPLSTSTPRLTSSLRTALIRFNDMLI
jgi:hypothetical protein